MRFSGTRPMVASRCRIWRPLEAGVHQQARLVRFHARGVACGGAAEDEVSLPPPDGKSQGRWRQRFSGANSDRRVPTGLKLHFDSFAARRKLMPRPIPVRTVGCCPRESSHRAQRLMNATRPDQRNSRVFRRLQHCRDMRGRCLAFPGHGGVRLSGPAVLGGGGIEVSLVADGFLRDEQLAAVAAVNAVAADF